jgi:hypothetical protein
VGRAAGAGGRPVEIAAWLAAGRPAEIAAWLAAVRPAEIAVRLAAATGRADATTPGCVAATAGRRHRASVWRAFAHACAPVNATTTAMSTQEAANMRSRPFPVMTNHLSNSRPQDK